MGKRTKPGKLVPCRCRSFEAGTTTDRGDGQEPFVTIETTGCDRQTNRLFAQGHDAKLVSFLVRAELAGQEIRWGRSTGTLHTGDAVGAAATVSEPLALKAKSMLALAREKAAKEKTRATIRAARKVERAPAPQPRLASIKIGRWTYAGAELLADGSARYKTAGGQERIAQAGKFQEVQP